MRRYRERVSEGGTNPQTTLSQPLSNAARVEALLGQVSDRLSREVARESCEQVIMLEDQIRSELRRRPVNAIAIQSLGKLRNDTLEKLGLTAPEARRSGSRAKNAQADVKGAELAEWYFKKFRKLSEPTKEFIRGQIVANLASGAMTEAEAAEHLARSAAKAYASNLGPGDLEKFKEYYANDLRRAYTPEDRIAELTEEAAADFQKCHGEALPQQAGIPESPTAGV